MSARSGAALLQACAIALAAGAVAATVVEQRTRTRARDAAERHLPVESTALGYVSSRSCRPCHLEQYASWHDSYHRTMTQPATPENVHAPFDGRALVDGVHRVKLQREGDAFFVDGQTTPGVLAPWAEFGRQKLALVTGSHHMQVYWYETGKGRMLGQLPFAWLQDEQRFIPRRAAFLRPPHAPRPVEDGRWNQSCIQCHTTQGRPRPTADGELDTRVAELGIACEACHGPGREHVAAHSSPLARYRGHLVDDASDDVVNPRRLDHEKSSAVCGQCHGIWQFKSGADERAWWDHGFAYRPGGDPEQSMWLLQPSRAAEDTRVAGVLKSDPEYVRGQFWPDGMARVSGRELNGMIDSPCYQRGELSCLSCHAMHKQADDARSTRQWADDQLKPAMDGDAACVQCHTELAEDVTAHTHHAKGSPGSECMNCHMPHTSYGLLKAMRSHQVSSPSAQSTLDSGRPNACNLCHLDRTLGFTADALSRFWHVPAPPLDDDRRALAESVVTLLRGDAAQRALYAWAMGWKPAQQASGSRFIAPWLALAMDDPYDAVRFIAGRSLRTLPGYAGFAFDSVPAAETREPSIDSVLSALPAGDAFGRRPQLALHDDGRPREDVTARLAAARDDRPIDLLE
jgi:hypothetical protein